MELQRHLLVFLVLIASCLVCSSHGYRFYAGGRDGWVLHPSEDYNHWAGRNRFQVNDTIYFKYTKGSDSVLVVGKDDYYNCNTKNPMKKMDDGDSVFKFEHSGPFFFISGEKDNCKKGQKLIVVVMAVRSPKSSMPPSFPVPATSPVSHPPKSSMAPSPHAEPPATSPVPYPPKSSMAPSPYAKPPASPSSPVPAMSPHHHVSPSSSPEVSPPSEAPSPSSMAKPPAGSHAPAPETEVLTPSLAPSSSESATPSDISAPAPAPSKSSETLTRYSGLLALSAGAVLSVFLGA